MIKLVIADDEERVCRLINALGDWDTLGIKVVGIARNGVEALQLLGREKVDILITDIRMPGYNGLELIERVKKLSDSTKVIIISGYASFDYEAMVVAGANPNGFDKYHWIKGGRQGFFEADTGSFHIREKSLRGIGSGCGRLPPLFCGIRKERWPAALRCSHYESCKESPCQLPGKE